MLDILDAIIATGGVVLALSLIVQAIQQIIKQMFDLKSSYMRRELLALFTNSGASGSFSFQPIGSLAKDADAVAKRIVKELEGKIASFGYKDLELLEDVSAEKLKQFVMTLPIAADDLFHKEFEIAKQEIDRWFDVSKKAFQDHYERRMKLWAFMISAVVVIALNSNLIVVYQDFAKNKTLREAAVKWTEQAVKNYKSESKSAGSGLADSTKCDSVAMARIKQNIAEIQGYVSEQSLQLYRWNTPRGDSMRWATATDDIAAAIAGNFFGWVAMTLLVSLGAPFWYDFLKTVMGVKDKLKGKER